MLCFSITRKAVSAEPLSLMPDTSEHRVAEEVDSADDVHCIYTVQTMEFLLQNCAILDLHASLKNLKRSGLGQDQSTRGLGQRRGPWILASMPGPTSRQIVSCFNTISLAKESHVSHGLIPWYMDIPERTLKITGNAYLTSTC